jgi:hypothetical protein
MMWPRPSRIAGLLTAVGKLTMYAAVSLMRVDGRALDMQQIRTADSPKGDLTVAHYHVSELGRYADVATLRSSQNDKESVLPPLFDVRLSHMGTNGFVLND